MYNWKRIKLSFWSRAMARKKRKIENEKLTQKNKNKKYLKKDMIIGELDAESDSELLNECFIDNGNLKKLLDVENPRSIIVGRTGSGKTALLLKVLEENKKNAIKLDPNDISIKFLEHSNILQYLTKLGVHLDLFYRFLWRHVLIIEFLKLKYGEKLNVNFLMRLFETDKAK